MFLNPSPLNASRRTSMRKVEKSCSLTTCEKVLVFDALRTSPGKIVDCSIYGVIAPFSNIANNPIAGAMKSLVVVNTTSLFPSAQAQPVHQISKCLGPMVHWWNLWGTCDTLHHLGRIHHSRTLTSHASRPPRGSFQWLGINLRLERTQERLPVTF